MLNISIIMRGVNFIWVMGYKFHDCNAQLPQCGEGSLNWGNMVFFVSALIFNIFNWLFTRLKIENLTSSTWSSETRLKVSLIIFHIPIAAFGFSTFIVYCGLDVTFENSIHFYRAVASVAYLSVSVAFIVVGKMFYNTLKRYSIVQAKEKRKSLIISISVVAIFFFIRGVFNIIRASTAYEVPFENKAWTQNDIGFPIYIFLYLFLWDILPIILITMMWNYSLQSFIRDSTSQMLINPVDDHLSRTK